MGCDRTSLPFSFIDAISIHAARVGCDIDADALIAEIKDFNPRSPSGLRLPNKDKTEDSVLISIHAARVGCDKHRPVILKTVGAFQSTQPEWAATEQRRLGQQGPTNFNPRSPSGLRLTALRSSITRTGISIHAARVGCDWCFAPLFIAQCISIHAARVGCDASSYSSSVTSFGFQSTQPEWAATYFERAQ